MHATRRDSKVEELIPRIFPQTPVDIIDDRKVISKGFLNIYEARDDSFPENQRQVGKLAGSPWVQGTEWRHRLLRCFLPSTLQL